MPGQRDALIAILLDGTSAHASAASPTSSPETPADADAIWITEVWDKRGARRLAAAAPFAPPSTARVGHRGFVSGQETIPVGGVGLPRER